MLILSINAFGQKDKIDSCLCNISVIKELRQNQKNLTSEMIIKFLRAYQPECKNNAEFSEAANWNLFYFMKENTIQTIKAIEISKNDPKVDINWIIQQFKMPVDDGIDVATIYNEVNKIQPKTDIVKKILENLKFATEGTDVKIKQ